MAVGMTTSTPQRATPKAFFWLTVVRLACLSALVVSAMLWVDYTAPAPAYCGAESGCAAVRASSYAHLGGVPTPLFGFVAFGAMLLLSVPPSRKARLLLWAYSVPVALGAAGFLALQFFVIGHVCAYCAVADVAGLIAFAAAWGLRRAEAQEDTPPEPKPAWRFLLLGVLAIAAPLVYPKLAPPSPLPPALRAYFVAGKVNVVEFADFECPYCRRLSPVLEEVIHDRGDSVHFVRLNHPLPFHRYADGAARAYLCADAEGHGESMARRLFAAESLDTPALLEQARAEGLDLPSFGECLTATSTVERLERESALFEEVGLRGLPSTFIGDELVVGAQPREVLERALDQAASGAQQASLGPIPFTALVVALAGLILWWPERRRSA